MLRLALLALALCVALLAGCGDDDDSTASADPQRYCGLVRELERAGQETFAKVEQQPNATAKDFEAAERQFVKDNEARLQELEQAAPEAVRPDVAILLDATRGRAGLGPPVPEGESGAAERRVQTFEKRNC